MLVFTCESCQLLNWHLTVGSEARQVPKMSCALSLMISHTLAAVGTYHEMSLVA